MGGDAYTGFPPEIPSDPARYLGTLNRYPLTSTPHNSDRRKECLWCDDVIKVTIQARGNTLDIDPKNPPKVAVPVAHLYHLSDGKKDAYYHMSSQKQADYDLWVYYSSKEKKAVWTLVEMSKQGNKLKAMRTDDFDYCEIAKDTTKARTTDADFADQKHPACSYDPGAPLSGSSSSLSATALLHAFVARLTALTVNPRTGGGWIDCNNGCCT